MANEGAVVGLLLAGGAAAVYFLAKRNQTGESGGVASQAGGGEGASPGAGGGLQSLSFYDPATGLPIDPSEIGGPIYGPDGTPRLGQPFPAPGGDQFAFSPGFSPAFEQEVLRQNDDLNRQLLQQTDQANRDVVAEQRKQTLATNLTLGVAVAATTPSAIRLAAKTPALLRAAPTLVRAAGPVGAGIGLGLAGVAALEKTGALDQVQKFGTNTIGKAPEPVQATVKTVALPLSTIGAVATGLVGRGSVGSNVRQAFRGTYVDKGVKGIQGFFR